jgi:hypothetical protein
MSLEWYEFGVSLVGNPRRCTDCCRWCFVREMSQSRSVRPGRSYVARSVEEAAVVQ